MIRYNEKSKKIARKLRSNMTDAEKKFWWRIRRKQLLGCQFYRQRPIDKYIVDFYCPRKKLVIEIDGGQHNFPENKEADKIRTNVLKKQLGLTILRFSNIEVLKNIEGVLHKTLEIMTNL